jgi:hypothetical protein
MSTCVIIGLAAGGYIFNWGLPDPVVRHPGASAESKISTRAVAHEKKLEAYCFEHPCREG